MSFRRKREAQLVAELNFHIANRTRDLVRAGMPEAEARRHAHLEFGGMETVKEDCRDLRRTHTIEELLKGLRYALRVFRKTPAFSVAAIGTLALGIGACTAVFTVVDDVLLRPLSYPQPDRLVKPLTKDPPLGIKDGPTSYPDYLDWRDSGVFENVGIYLQDNVVLSVGGQSERVVAIGATSGVLAALRVKPLAGRLFTEAESKPSLSPVALLTERTWRRRFGSDPKLLGGIIKVNGFPTAVVGILPASFTFEGDPELWTSLVQTGDEASRDNRYWDALARLRKGATLAQTGVQMDQVSRRLAAAYPGSNRDWGVDLVGLKESMVGDTRPQLLVLMGAVGFVWLIVCANIATLLLVRASGRSREMAVRAALGASGARLARQLATETLVLVLAGGAAGIGLALASVASLRAYGPADLPRLDQVQVDAASVAFTLCVAMLTGLLASLGPVFRTRRQQPGASLQEGGRGATGGRRRSLTRAALVTGEVALSIVLLTGSGLLIKSFTNLLSQDPGFRTDHLLTFFLWLPNTKVMENGKYQKAKVERYVDAVTARLAAIPGVQHVGLGMPLLLGGGGYQVWSKFWVAGESKNQAGFVHGISQAATTDYFAALGVRLRSGRNFSPADRPETPAVTIINEEFARQKFAHRNPIGMHIGIESDPKTYEIVA